MAKQDITAATNRLCDLIPGGHLLADTMPANFLNVVADKLETSKQLLKESKQLLIEYGNDNNNAPHHHREFLYELNDFLNEAD